MTGNDFVRIFNNKKNTIIIASIITGAFLLRMWALSWGLPLRQAHIDESVMIFYSMHFFSGHVFYDYPTFFVYLLWIIYSAAFVLAKCLGLCASLDQFVGIYLHGDPSLFYLLARLVSVCAGTASVYLLYKIGKEQWGQGIAPAIVLAVLPYHVLHSHYGTTDVTSVFFVLLAFLYIGRYYSSITASDLYKGCFILGVATATKYYPAIFLMPLSLFVAVREQRNALKPLLFSYVWV
ncbi:MAG: glycosyltransferase family 39 protein, partial [Endomicrobiales bacterium]